MTDFERALVNLACNGELRQRVPLWLAEMVNCYPVGQTTLGTWQTWWPSHLN